MARIRKTIEAVEDTYEIWSYIAKDSPKAADRLLDQIEEKLAILSEAPRIGTQRNEFARGLRSFPIDNYILFYNETSDGIELVRIIHGARDIPTEFPS